MLKGTPHMEDPTHTLAVWFTDPPGVVVSFVRRAPCTVPLAEWLTGPVRVSLLERYPGNGPLVLVLDLSEMEGRDPLARRLVIDAAAKMKARARRTVVVPPIRGGRVYLASLQVAASVARVLGLTFSVESLADALRSLRPATSLPSAR